ncbi:hypothetical protein RYA05_05700 [Pseudomonas syringae pv. actinidiae]|nr:hypothetical protein [Pseudomonas syringae pv. actinidiae]
MPVNYNNSSLTDLKVDLIQEVINNAEFSAKDFITKSALAKSPVSRFSDKQPAFAEKDQRVTASLIIDIGELPIKEARFIADVLDKYGDQKGGKLTLTETMIKADFDPVAVRERICKYATGKFERSIKEHGIGQPELPQESAIVINQEAKTGLLDWIKQSVRGRDNSQSHSMS